MSMTRRAFFGAASAAAIATAAPMLFPTPWMTHSDDVFDLLNPWAIKAEQSSPGLTIAKIIKAKDAMRRSQPKLGELIRMGGRTFQNRGDVFVEVIAA
jgi:hypothetical protein